MFDNDNGTWHRVGEAPVDSGTMMLVDPCYVLRDKRDEDKGTDNGLEYSDALGFDKPEDHPESYASRKAALERGDFEAAYRLGKGGGYDTTLGFFFDTNFGDGVYPVYARVSDNGRCTGVFIDFDDHGELDEDEVEDETSSAF